MASPQELQALREATNATWAEMARLAGGGISKVSMRAYTSGWRDPSPAVNARLDRMLANANRGLGQADGGGWTFGQIAAAGGLLAFVLWLASKDKK